MSKANNIASLLNSSGLLDSDDIATSAITNSKIASGAIDSDAIGTDAITAAKLNIGQIGGRRNIIINGAMQVAQRGGAGAVGVSGLDYYSADRMKNYISYGTGNITYASVTTDGNSFKPAFQNSVKYSNLTGGAPTGSQQVSLLHYIEGQDLQHLEYGTSNAKTLTLSFWVKTNKTGAYSVEFFAVPTSGSNRGYTKTFTVSSTNWEYHTLTIEGDTASDIRNSNNYGLLIKFWLAAGTDFTGGTLQTSWQDRVAGNAVSSSNVNLADSSSNEFEITGLQLELGETATPFEHRSYGEELALCQRYFVRYSGGQFHRLCFGYNDTATRQQCTISTPTELRAIPALSHTNLTNSGTPVSSISNVQTLNAGRIYFGLNSAGASFTTGAINQAYWDSASGNTFDVNAEL